ncbi:MAG: TrkH family potassium uptake protein, partial [Gammaproteobacteria bacterium]
FFAYLWAGMGPFDALGHAFASVATGGFSTHDASIGHYNSIHVELVAIALMWFGSVSFALHFSALRNIHRGKFSLAVYLNDPEFRFYNAFLLAIIALVTFGLWWHNAYDSPGESLRHAAFQSVSYITSTGFATQDFAQWPSFVPWLLLFAFFFGGCAGSTSGGMKALRILLLVKQSLREFQRLTHPNGVFLVKLGKQPVSEGVVEAVWGFVSLYIFVTLVLSLLLMTTGLEFDIAFSAAATAINNTGPGLGPLSSNVSSLTDPAVWIMSFGMLVGRLEVFTVLILLTPMFWRR